MGRPFSENGSCRHDAYDGKLPEEHMCQVCKDHSRYSDKTLRRMKDNGDIEIEGVCQQLHGSLPREVAVQRAAANSSPARRGRRRPTKRFEPSEQRKTSGKKLKPSEIDEKRKALATLGVNVENIHFNTNGGKSRGAVSKMATTAGAALTAISQVISPSDPNAARSLAVSASLKRDPTIKATMDDSSNEKRHPPTASRRESEANGQDRIQRAQAAASALAEENTKKQRKLDACTRSLGTDLVSRLKGMSIAEARPILAAGMSFRHIFGMLTLRIGTNDRILDRTGYLACIILFRLPLQAYTACWKL